MPSHCWTEEGEQFLNGNLVKVSLCGDRMGRWWCWWPIDVVVECPLGPRHPPIYIFASDPNDIFSAYFSYSPPPFSSTPLIPLPYGKFDWNWAVSKYFSRKMSKTLNRIKKKSQYPIQIYVNLFQALYTVSIRRVRRIETDLRRKKNCLMNFSHRQKRYDIFQ